MLASQAVQLSPFLLSKNNSNEQTKATAILQAKGVETPMKPDAFALTDAEKIERIQANVRDILDTLGMDLTDDSLRGTPKRVAEMYVNELFNGLNPAEKPRMVTFENSYQYNKMLVEKNISFHSACEHHLMPIIGKAHVGYVSSGRVIGLSKINRLVKYYARRPQVQERMTLQILEDLKDVLNTDDVAVVIEAKHMCVIARGVADEASSTVTTEFSGRFLESDVQHRFLEFVRSDLM